MKNKPSVKKPPLNPPPRHGPRFACGAHPDLFIDPPEERPKRPQGRPVREVWEP